MRSWKKPTPDQIDRAVALLIYDGQYRYFFDQLENPEWLEPLWKKGFFKHPLQPVRNEEEGTIRFPPWPESRYLARMASHKPELVAQIIEEMEETENISVQSDLLDAMCAMPPDIISAIIVEKAVNWAETPYLFLPEKLGAFMVHLAKCGKVEEALRLASVLLDVLPAARPFERRGEEHHELPVEPRAHLDVWNYEQILKQYYPELVQTAPLPALKLLCSLLDKAIRLSQHDDESERDKDFSFIWRPAIEDHPQNICHGPKDLLVYGVREAAEIAVRLNKTSLSEVIGIIKIHRWKVFQRIILHLLRVFREQAIDLVTPYLTDRQLFEDIDVRHEYVMLLRESFSDLSTSEQQTILNWIEKGPDIEQFKDRWQRKKDETPSSEELGKYCESWQRDRLAWIGPQNLPEAWQEKYRTLAQRFGEPEHPEFPLYTEITFGQSSPKTSEELKAMSVEEIVSFLERWQPQEISFMAPSPEELGRILTSVVAEDPQRFAEHAERFQGLDPIYVRSLLSGFREAVETHKQTLDWCRILHLCRWVLTQPRAIPGRRVHVFDADTDWGWTRKTIADLLSAGFKAGNGEIPIRYRKDVWSILHLMTEDPDPTPEHEASYGGPNMDPATLSLNTTRGTAMHAVIQYALWVQRCLEKQANICQPSAKDFDQMPEVREVLDTHLNLAHDPSLAIRAVYGWWFPWLVVLDEEWARKHVAHIFPIDRQNYYVAAWNAYLAFNKPYDNVLNPLYEQYGHAAEQIGHLKGNTPLLPDPDERLAEHLMEFYWRGKLSLDDPLLAAFWEKAPSTLRNHALEFVGRALKQTYEEIPGEIVQRLKELWEYRLEQAKRSSSPAEFAEELSAFGWWFVSNKFEVNWAIEQLEESLHFAGQTKSDHMVLEQLANTAEIYPLESVKCLKMIAEKDTEGWRLYSSRDYIRQILQVALNAANARQETERVIHYLGSRGFLDYKDLLKY